MKEIISDSSFETIGKSDSKWSVLTHEGVSITPLLRDPVLRMKVENTSGANWHGELRYSPFVVEAGQTFRVSFAAKAEHPFTFSVWLGQQDAPHKSLVSEENHFGEKLMTKDWQIFTHTWKAAYAESKARLNFVIGQIENLIDLKDVSLIQS